MPTIGTSVLPLAALVALLSAGCYRPSDEYLARKGEKPPARAPDAGDPADLQGEVAAGDPAAQPEPVAPAPDAGMPVAEPEGPGPQPDAETVARDMFGRHDMKALPELDKLVGTRPGELDELVRGAFAGVGNDTDKCQEILLYLTVRHMHQAEALAAAAAQANPEIQSFTQ